MCKYETNTLGSKMQLAQFFFLIIQLAQIIILDALNCQKKILDALKLHYIILT